jgi:hypothetical protein
MYLCNLQLACIRARQHNTQYNNTSSSVHHKDSFSIRRHGTWLAWHASHTGGTPTTWPAHVPKQDFLRCASVHPQYTVCRTASVTAPSMY